MQRELRKLISMQDHDRQRQEDTLVKFEEEADILKREIKDYEQQVDQNRRDRMEMESHHRKKIEVKIKT